MFINKYSVKCLLGPRAKIEYYNDNIFCWSVNSKNHLAILNGLALNDINYIQSLGETTFHYCSVDNLGVLERHFRVEKTKITNTILNIDNVDFIGKKNRQFRNYLNRYDGLVVADKFNDISEIKNVISKWTDQLADKYFRNYSGKNVYFFKQGYHKDCDCVFIYRENELVAFGVASPMINGECSYILGKALAITYPGMSEFADIQLYKKLFNKYGKFKIDMGMGMKGLLSYKEKFPGAIREINYNGQIV